MCYRTSTWKENSLHTKTSTEKTPTNPLSSLHFCFCLVKGVYIFRTIFRINKSVCSNYHLWLLLTKEKNKKKKSRTHFSFSLPSSRDSSRGREEVVIHCDLPDLSQEPTLFEPDFEVTPKYGVVTKKFKKDTPGSSLYTPLPWSSDLYMTLEKKEFFVETWSLLGRRKRVA